MRYLIAVLTFVIMIPSAWGVRLKDMANIRGVRDNQLVGYGLIVGLKGTGDSKSEFTNKSMKRMLEKLGMKVEDGEIAKKNVAAVLITATLPPFARAGNKIDITVNSIGDAASLEGGTIVQTPLRGADQNTYAVAQGPIIIGKGSGKNVHTTVGYIPGGGIIEKDVLQESFSNRKMYRLTLHNPDITTSVRVAHTVNLDLGGKYATAVDPATIDIVVPFSYEGKGVELLATIESLEVEPDTRAKVVVNEKTGTVIIGENVRISTVAISHGDINLKVGKKAAAASPAPPPIDIKPELAQPPQAPVESRGLASVPPSGTLVATEFNKENKEPVPGSGLAKTDGVKMMKESVSVGELVQTLNQMGVSPKDLIIILQNIKASGALQGELEIL
ncbi:MAG: flagellar basal body P-ring protein FlgI [Bdellovibrionaceae bacterium]|nr:flagellar basal body P-ring protein FlgI [Pseudobdellovibrionaceae bacterium]